MNPRRYLTVDDWRLAFDAEVLEDEALEEARLDDEAQGETEFFPLSPAGPGAPDSVWEEMPL